MRRGDDRAVQVEVGARAGVAVVGLPGRLPPVAQLAQVLDVVVRAARRGERGGGAVEGEPELEVVAAAAAASWRSRVPVSSELEMTNVPRPCSRRSSPAWTSDCSASRTVLRPTPNSATSAASVGIRSPTAQRPETISSRKRAAAWSMRPTRRIGPPVPDCSRFIP
ncbi:hypothetical protein IU11_12870 [Cellulosimicrobium sp. MM]|nr:hypothetical protein IU11_12870 [Cellulosimicrobium sp. MM]